MAVEKQIHDDIKDENTLLFQYRAGGNYLGLGPSAGADMTPTIRRLHNAFIGLYVAFSTLQTWGKLGGLIKVPCETP
jgi:hypothetical protein